jgi:hypothetical protein
VPGKKLLPSLHAGIRSTYGINFGNERLAEGFAADEIPQEIKDLLERVSAFMSAR